MPAFVDLRRALAAFAFAIASPVCLAQPAESKPAETRSEGTLAQLAWLAGCWRGSVNQREFREHWLPLRGDLLIGAGHTVAGGRTQDYEYIRLEQRADGVHYVAAPRNQKETAFRLADRKLDGPDEIFTFVNPGHDFPQSIIYRRATGGWLYVHVEGKVGNEERKVIYPLRRVDCESGEFLAQ